MAGRGCGKSYNASKGSTLPCTSMNVDKEVLQRRAARFTTPDTSTPRGSILDSLNAKLRRGQDDSNNVDYEFEQEIIGTCQLLEKCYLRLTSAPKESEIRPRHILVKSLERVKELWAINQDYKSACELLKSIRQDLTVQGIQDNLTIDVYETHARLALLSSDHAEFNVCQSRLITLYEDVKDGRCNQDEFTAYRFLYYMFTKDIVDLSSLVSQIATKDKQNDCISHSLNVVIAWLSGHYHTLFKLYRTAPNMSSRVMDLFLTRERTVYFNVLIRAYRPSIPTSFLTTEFEIEDDAKTLEFLSSVGAVFTDASNLHVDCKKTLAKTA